VNTRSLAKSIVERTLVASGAAAWSAHQHRREICVLAYHNVVPDDLPWPGDASLHLRRRDFRDQLDHLGRRYDVVPLTAVLGPPSSGPRPRVAITFDDAYQGALDIGVEELARRGMPATVFVPPGLLGGRSLWWDVYGPPRPLAAGGSSGGLTPGMRAEALSDAGGRDAAVVDWARHAGWVVHELSVPMRTGTEAELAAACRRHDGLTLGSHSWSHPDLAQLDQAALEVELRAPLEWLRARFPCTIPWLTYPYGLSSPQVERATRASGYEAGVLVVGGWTRIAPENPFAIPRANIPAGISPAGFALRVGGLHMRGWANRA
jgi:peptidoglycan/xylan/chitin deacetylase (PgdA/CDA1 family)